MILIRLNKHFINKYEERPDLGLDDMGELVLMLKYSRLINGKKETWRDIVERVVNGLWWIFDTYIHHDFSFIEQRLMFQEMFDHIYNMKVLPAGRPLANLGTFTIQERRIGEELYNCAGISFLNDLPYDVVAFIMHMSMHGVGVGINVNTHNQKLFKPTSQTEIFVIPDTTEGWVEAVYKLVKSYTEPAMSYVGFDYSEIRPAGSPIRGKGGIHEGYVPLMNMLESIRKVLDTNDRFSTRVAADISNLIGVCVVNGGQRRTALLLAGNETDEFCDLKDYNKNPERSAFGFTSNNTIYSSEDDDLKSFVDRVFRGVDLGIMWLKNSRTFGRMGDKPEFDDFSVVVPNPCGEIVLEPYELCNLIEFNPNRIEKGKYKNAIKIALLIGKIISCMEIKEKTSQRIIRKNRRIGISQSGIVLFMEKIGKEAYKEKLNEWYEFIQKEDKRLSKRLRINKSIRTTTVKPSGSLSKVMGTTAGIHFPTSEYIIRRVEIPARGGYVELMRSKGYNVVPSVYKENVFVVEFPISYKGYPTVNDVSVLDQLELTAFMQEHWADNAVSVTVSIDKSCTPELLEYYLYKYRDKLKSLSFLMKDDNIWEQTPEEPISYETYCKMLFEIEERKKSNGVVLTADAEVETGCTSEVCEFP